ncbi:DUF2975 domain-containing protein [Parasulfitobacter algicola]|uniref:DUF2975 domain-containing protein n=1 Tax=Parasulfitobacter algicola TaxID=2614809 RepID=A0ABX2IU00_9RHOB|nr:DUF2975 domain-containing protein [Sulfitobacter algicola]NSX53653.1 DUF2975 domain-containing protein [Sulfitobacter algicola]
MINLNNVQKWARNLEWLTMISLIVIPVAIAATLFTTPITPDMLDQRLETFAVSPNISQPEMYIAVTLNLIPVIILLFTLNTMRQLFGLYRQGQILTDTCARLIQRIGQGFLALALAPFLLNPMLSYILSRANPSGERSISVSLNSDMFFFAIAGGLIIIIGWALREASDLAAENRAFV